MCCRPGSARIFGASAYLWIVAVLCILPIFAYFYIRIRKVGLLRGGLTPAQDVELAQYNKLYEADQFVNDVMPKESDSSSTKSFTRWVAPVAILEGWNAFSCWGIMSSLLPYAAYHTVPTDQREAENGGAILQYIITLSYMAQVIGDLGTLFVPSYKLR